ncbi:MAG: replicative DNA helicase [Candidatus Gastranaerophilales bacterium]|nr:replicative DNA helicase [Candidatus Gastranaerophilales bacterium]
MAKVTALRKIEKLPPQSLEAEEAVLGAVLVNPMSIIQVMESLAPEHFYKPAHKQIYSAMIDLCNKSQPIDVVTVSEYLRDADKLELVGGRAYINDLALNVITTANIEYYAKIISEKSVLRELINAGTEIVTQAYDESSSEMTLDTAEKLIFSIAQKKVSKDLIPIKELIMPSYSMIEYRYNNRDELIGVPSGFIDLDNITAGFQPSDLIILAARPSMGKTAFSLNIAQEVAIRKKLPTAIFSLEMSKEQLVQRVLCSEAEIDSNRLRTGHMQSDDWSRLTNAMGTIAEAPMYIDDSPAATIMDIRAKCRRLTMEHGKIGLVIIDYLQLMGGTSNNDRVQEISAISRGLKGIARELNVPIIALSQLSRAVESRTIKKPMLSDLRESGAIEQDADIVMFIYREDYYDPENVEKRGKAEIIIAKQRNGPVGSVELLFQPNITRFKNPTQSMPSF